MTKSPDPPELLHGHVAQHYAALFQSECGRSPQASSLPSAPVSLQRRLSKSSKGSSKPSTNGRPCSAKAGSSKSEKEQEQVDRYASVHTEATAAPTRNSLDEIESVFAKPEPPRRADTDQKMCGRKTLCRLEVFTPKEGETAAEDQEDKVKKDCKHAVFLSMLPQFRRSEDPKVAPTLLSKVVNHPLFDALCAAMILLNSLLIGVSTEYLTTHDEEAPWMSTAGDTCSGFFLLELILRLRISGCQFFLSPEDRNWNTFDFVLVMLSVIDFVMARVGGGVGSVGSTLKTIKMLRIVRLFRVFRFFKELSLLALMIADSIKSLCWALVMLTIILYVFAICFTQTTSEFVRLQGGGIDHNTRILQKQWGSLATSVYHLIMSMLGGISWGEVSGPLMHIGMGAVFLFMFYIAFVLLAVLNIITGVFVDNAVETAKGQRDFIIQKEREQNVKWAGAICELFHQMDEDCSGTVSWDEMERHFSNEAVQGLFKTLGLSSDDLHLVFRLIDIDGSGEVNIDEFFDGCLKLKGEARSIDVHAIWKEVVRLHRTVDDLYQTTFLGQKAVVKKLNTFKNEHRANADVDFGAIAYQAFSQLQAQQVQCVREPGRREPYDPSGTVGRPRSKQLSDALMKREKSSRTSSQYVSESSQRDRRNSREAAAPEPELLT
eukprot:TRINITY_DN44758_c0_g1_i1.p1 TRINITY_DN44758_c0_g1~~TRINITY_DN44758_c0_g1_i1.p1  ORF type:complete len:661 (+),score=102.15 TRINITY_DN44758_c0_g1_i1:238-2220(+)